MTERGEESEARGAERGSRSAGDASKRPRKLLHTLLDTREEARGEK